jgi:hypothetical protein
MIANAPWYVSNATLHNDLGLPFIQDVIRQKSNRHYNTIKTHVNPLLKPLLIQDADRR